MDRQEYLDTRKGYIDSASEQQALIDKSILTLSSFALGFSLAIIQAVNSSNNVLGTTYLKISWILFGSTIIASILSMVFSQECFYSYLAQLDQQQMTNSNNPLKSCWSIATRLLNWLSILLFFLGTCSLVIFSWQNI